MICVVDTYLSTCQRHRICFIASPYTALAAEQNTSSEEIHVYIVCVVYHLIAPQNLYTLTIITHQDSNGCSRRPGLDLAEEELHYLHCFIVGDAPCNWLP